MNPTIIHHGAREGVTGSCHELNISNEDAILIDCGLFQGAEVSPGGADARRLEIEFPVEHIRALVVTHVHIDHVGRIPYLLAAGFNGPVYCSGPSALLLPEVIEDALRVGVTRNRRLIDKVLVRLKRQLHPLPYGQWQAVDVNGDIPLAIRLQQAGHILGSAWVMCRVGQADSATEVIFSGDLGAPHTPLLAAPDQPSGCDILVLESTYGDRNHQHRRERQQTLQTVIERALRNRGSVLIPAFSIGRTQELLYELEDIIHQNKVSRTSPSAIQGDTDASSTSWDDMDIILDSPLAARFTRLYRKLRPYWDAEARHKLEAGRHPLAFEQLTTIDGHEDHLNAVDYLARTHRPAIVIAAGGMCAGGRVVNYLKAMLEDERHDVLFVGYQAKGTPGRDIQQYGPDGGYVDLDNRRYQIRANVETISGYSAHADQAGLVGFVRGMQKRPGRIILVHGDAGAKRALQEQLEALH